jgi:hypothetical protein
MLRTLRKDNWTNYIEKVAENINHIPKTSLYGLSPAEINSHQGDIILDERKKELGKEDDVEDYLVWEQNQKDYLKSNAELKPGKLVYIKIKQQAFLKSHDLRVSVATDISSITERLRKDPGPFRKG